MPHVAPALRAYNLAQLHVVEHSTEAEVSAHTVGRSALETRPRLLRLGDMTASDYQSILSEAAILPGSETERYIDAEGKRTFAFDHVTLVSAAAARLRAVCSAQKLTVGHFRLSVV